MIGEPGFATDDHQVVSDGDVVWVHTAGGTIARFGRNGIDVHTRDTTACLYCTHKPTQAVDWDTFVAKVWEHHGVFVGDEHKPRRFRAVSFDGQIPESTVQWGVRLPDGVLNCAGLEGGARQVAKELGGQLVKRVITYKAEIRAIPQPWESEP